MPDDRPTWNERRIAELESALETAARRFELLACVNDSMVNGVRPSVGAAECRQALQAGNR